MGHTRTVQKYKLSYKHFRYDFETRARENPSAITIIFLVETDTLEINEPNIDPEEAPATPRAQHLGLWAVGGAH